MGELDLTPREREVLDLIVKGKSRRQVARALDISVHTVDGYIRSLSSKIPGELPPMRRFMVRVSSNPELLEG